MSLGDVITQKEVDAVASLVEAAGELDLEPFFGVDEPFTTTSGSSEYRIIYQLGDRFHFRSALISFRRIWMPTEPSHWRKVSRILSQAEIPGPIRTQASLQAQIIENFIRGRGPRTDKEMERDKIVDLWLNTVFAHGGVAGRNKRSDFEAAADKYGQGRFEFEFRMCVKLAGEMFRALSKNAAKPALDVFKDQLSLQPSFRIGAAFGTKRKEVTKHGELIIRQASSEHFSEETFEERFHRILRRRHFQSFAFLLPRFDLTPVDILKAVVTATSFVAFVEKLGGSLEVTEGEGADGGIHEKLPDGFSGFMTIEDDSRPCGRILISRQGKIFRTTPRAVIVLDRALVRFKEELLAD
jgi:hypothetical protein